MKINRRHFLALGMGATAGTLLSPLPWKLTDDVSIWTQNWSWTPVPKTGESIYLSGACTLCPGGCSLSVRTVGNRVVKIEGSEESPVNTGDACGVGISAPQLLYGPSRIKSPMVRVGKRGEGKWKEIDWDEAESLLAEKLTNVKDARGVAALSPWASGSVATLFQRMLDLIGSDNFLTLPSQNVVFEQAMEMTMGLAPGEGVGFDFENSDLILSFGSAVAEGWGSPVRMVKVAGSKKMIHVEPRLSTTATMADMWVPAKPGTEGIFALSVAASMVKEKLYDHIFVGTSTRGFKGFQSWLLRNFDPAKTEKITGIKPVMTKKVAVAFAGAKRPVAICGRGKGETPTSLAETLAVFALNALKGSIQRDGGLVKVAAAPYASASASAKGMGEKLKGLFSGRVSLLMDWGTNPFYTLVSSEKAKASLASIETIVSFSPYMDETAAMADLILPDHTHLEKLQDVPVRAGFEKPTVTLATPCLYEPLYSTRHTGDVLINVGKSFDGGEEAFGWDDFEGYVEESCGEMWESLSETGIWQGDITWKRGLERLVGSREKFTFVIPKGPLYTAPERAESTYPLTLVPISSLRISSGPVADAPFTMKTIPDHLLSEGFSHVELHPETAKKLGLKDGEKATLSTPSGKATVKVSLFDGLMPGVVAMADGLGHSAFDDFIGGKGASYKALSGSMVDPESGLNCTWGSRAALAKG